MSATATAHTLSSRELEILSELARGFTYAQTAQRKNVSTNTVRFHVKQIYAKLQVSSKSQAVYQASRLGLISLG